MTVPLIAASTPLGAPDAPLLLLGPSLGTSGLVWDAAASQLQQTFRTVSWDLPGHGMSPPTREPFSVAELAEGVLRVIDELEAPRVFLAGVSLGGAVSLTLTLAHPERVDATAILCSGAVIGTPEGWAERAAAARISGTPSLVVASAQRWFAPESMAANPDVTGRLLHSLRDADDESYALCCEALAGYDLRPELARLTTPILAAWGEFDLVAPEASAVEIAAGAGGGTGGGTGSGLGQVAELAGAGHLAPAERPTAVAELLTAFFEEHR